MKKLNCLGDFCPVPAIKTTTELKRLKAGETLIVLVDHSCALENIKDTIKNLVESYTVAEVANGIWEITIVKK